MSCVMYRVLRINNIMITFNLNDRPNKIISQTAQPACDCELDCHSSSFDCQEKGMKEKKSSNYTRLTSLTLICCDDDSVS